MVISQGDFDFLKFAMKRLNIHEPIKILRYKSKKTYPDIWIDLGKKPVEIWVTKEWSSHDMHTRRRQLLHEILHLKGLEHGTYNGLEYSTYPAKDTYSIYQYKQMIRK